MFALDDSRKPLSLWVHQLNEHSYSWCAVLERTHRLVLFNTFYEGQNPWIYITLWDFSDFRVISESRFPGEWGAWKYLAMPTGPVVVGYYVDRLHLFRPETAEPPRAIHNDTRRHFTDIAFHPSGQWLAATSNDETVKFYDTETWQLAKTFAFRIGRMRSIAFSPDGTLAAAGSDTGQVVIWDVGL
jgi:WD40 repeat protein